MQFDIRLITRNDFIDNWESSGSIIRRGELAIAFDSLGNPVELKIGEDKTWNNTDTGLVPFKPIVTTLGRNLDNPGGARTTSWNLGTLNEALLEIFAPYVLPGVSLSPNSFANQEVGTTYAVTGQLFNAALTNVQNILIEGNRKIYVDGTAISIGLQGSLNTNESITKTFSANRTTSGNYEVLNVFIKNNRDSGQIAAVANVPFKLRSGYFLWKNNDNLLTKTDSEISTIIQSMTGNVTGVRNSSIATDGNKNFGQITFNTASVPTDDSSTGGDGFYNLYVYNPTSAGTPVLSTPGDETTPLTDITYKTFNYTKGNATTSYKLTKLNTTSKLLGIQPLNIN